MNKQTEALKMAIEAMAGMNNARPDKPLTMLSALAKLEKAIQACKEALKQHEKLHKVKLSEQPAQEPVAYVEYAWVTDADGLQSPEKRLLEYDNGKCQPLYTHPAPSWQGLSDDEIENIFQTTYLYEHRLLFARAIEQALKEKNGR